MDDPSAKPLTGTASPRAILRPRLLWVLSATKGAPPLVGQLAVPRSARGPKCSRACSAALPSARIKLLRNAAQIPGNACWRSNRLRAPPAGSCPSSNAECTPAWSSSAPRRFGRSPRARINNAHSDTVIVMPSSRPRSNLRDLGNASRSRAPNRFRSRVVIRRSGGRFLASRYA